MEGKENPVNAVSFGLGMQDFIMTILLSFLDTVFYFLFERTCRVIIFCKVSNPLINAMNASIELV
jgi:hypothetical protein